MPGDALNRCSEAKWPPQCRGRRPWLGRPLAPRPRGVQWPRCHFTPCGRCQPRAEKAGARGVGLLPRDRCVVWPVRQARLVAAGRPFGPFESLPTSLDLFPSWLLFGQESPLACGSHGGRGQHAGGGTSGCGRWPGRPWAASARGPSVPVSLGWCSAFSRNALRPHRGARPSTPAPEATSFWNFSLTLTVASCPPWRAESATACLCSRPFEHRSYAPSHLGILLCEPTVPGPSHLEELSGT